MGRPRKVTTTVEDPNRALADILAAVKSIGSRLDTVEQRLNTPEKQEPVSARELPAMQTGTTSTASATNTASATKTGSFVPQGYREIVDKVLNKHFELNVYPSYDSPTFQLEIIVPDKYTSISAEYRKMYGADRRVKVIGLADGLNGVRQYAELVFSSFNPDMRAQILGDRIRELEAVSN